MRNLDFYEFVGILLPGVVLLAILEPALRKLLRNDSFELKQDIDSGQWYSITRQVYGFVSAAGRAQRIDIFNGNYGLCRGVAAALLVSLAIVSVKDWANWRAELLLLGLAALAIYRMHRFGVRYGRELFVQFIQAST